MKNSYRFYRNIDCEYFPCHNVKDEENFNCLFCYCPLYFLEECGGNYFDNNGIKDCTNCLIPHRPRGYDYVKEKIMEINKQKRRTNT
ncbi:cysteine-rich small domain-containing protein [Tepidimicrobium xylanilyticum]|uniref:cysteine-rich small domain-containing protein n=1 Tax=Tepidimicrobium xylanilyticum TaxID=1123352 RepID=UPI0026540A93|nr:cysteine-rich small domain-containing protein [Tepidimicrobium xylanilyticum]GMG95945.1 metal-binding protein [Tepidimicrobium xylanilyticum]